MDIIVPVFNNVDITARCLAALCLFKPKGSRIILVDNGSTDPISSLRPWVESMGGTYLRLEKNVGPYGAVNAGMAAGTDPVVAVVCNDVVVMPATLQNLEMLLRPEIGLPLIGAKEVDNKTFDFLTTARQCPQSKDATLTPTQGYFTCFVALRMLFAPEAIGPFDERFKLTFGDTDWEERYGEAGFTYFQTAHGIVYHGSSVTRKRGGIEADVAVDSADHALFLEKWAGSPEVCQRHQANGNRALSTQHAWAARGES